MNDRGDGDPVRVLCVDDNALIVDSLVARLRVEPWIEVAGAITCADNLIQIVTERDAAIVLLDVDMPGRSAFQALEELTASHPDVRTIMLSGHVGVDLIDRAIASGAWGYVSKSAGAGAVVEAVRTVRNGEFAFSTDVPAEDAW